MNIGNLSGMYPNYALYANTNPINPSARATGSDTDLTAVDSLGKKEAHSTDPDKIKKAGKRSSPEECETCANRKYQDGSDEGNVSFKTASHVSPESAGARVRAHWPRRPADGVQQQLALDIPEDYVPVLDALKASPDATVNDLCLALAMPFPQLSSLLFRMELDDYVVALPGGRYAIPAKS